VGLGRGRIQEKLPGQGGSVHRAGRADQSEEPALSRSKGGLDGAAGVGKKVADCVLLYGLDFLEAFPIDTWIKKGLQKAYFRNRRVGPKKMEEFVSRHFGRFAGYAQLYLYHYWRNQPIR